MPSSEPINILLVDDRPEGLLTLEAVLTSPQYRLLKANSGREALAQVSSQEVALVLLDVQMPGMDGLETARRLREDPRHRDIPIIFITAINQDRVNIFRGYQSGAIDYLLKPFDDEVLKAKVAVIAELYQKNQRIKHQEAVLAKTNEELKREIQERVRAELALRKAQENLEQKIIQRTAELSASNAALQAEVQHRRRAEEDVQQLNADLQRRALELLKANRDLEAFSYSVSHDLRAPLRAIDGFSRILTTEYAARLEDEGRRLLGIICANVKTMNQLIDSLLSLSRLTRQSVRKQAVDMSQLVADVLEETRKTEPHRQVEIKCSPLPNAVGDPTMLRQVFTNLVANARKFTHQVLHPVIEIGSYQENGWLVYYVKDNGIGFDMRYAPKLFGVFQRLHSVKEFEGTGVGLAIVQRILHTHGGRVWAQGQPHAGATFFFALPEQCAYRAPAEAELQPVSQMDAPADTLSLN